VSTSAILPISSIDFGSTSATSSQQTVLNNLLSQLQQAVGTGDLTTSATLLNAVEALSPSSAAANNPLGAFLTNLSTALNDGSTSEAQTALTTYQSATPATSSAASSASTAAATSATAAEIAAGLIQSQIQFNLVSTLLGPNSSFGSDAGSGVSSSSDSSSNSLIGLLNAAYGTGSSSSSGSTGSSTSGSSTSAVPAAISTTPYDALVSSIQASLAGGSGTITPALAYLQASGNFVNTTA
jgi:hypothetical protein